MATMLQLVQQATGEMGLSVPSAVASNTSDGVVQQLALLNAVGYELQREFQWQKLTKEYQFNTVFYEYTGDTTDGSTTISGMSSIVGLSSLFLVTGAGIADNTQVVSATGSSVVITPAAQATGTAVSLTFGQTKYAFPSDFDRLIDRTDWDKSKHWEMLGPESAQQWQWLKSGYISTGPRIRFRELGGYFQIWPIISTQDLLGFEYVSANWATSTLGVEKAAFTADTDTCVFPDRLMVLGLKKKYYEAKGFYSSRFDKDYERHLSISKAADAGSPTLSMAPSESEVLIDWQNIPDSGYGL